MSWLKPKNLHVGFIGVN